MKNIYKLNLDLYPLSESEMLQIRGGAEVPKPKSRPRDVFDEELAALQQSKTTNNEESIFALLLIWLKK